eukprot:TRINITY_DN15572_c0_g1::TRINITY_DN15572_c0_g1_i1::g.28483::m.28483 TRINITY_DN15572_c0_g1::TRINITY_DN15572_c0_g1_i1::g.28483  ORF type:complete len:249 (-),score=26.27,sp/P22062/PIMT_RAT/55.16/7e-80,PCMT/PF01135.14/1.4e-73,Methyltransf_31/PF13847.1/3.7e+03,Methyltransf_31/PF13847.1/1.5e-08,Methyltransf_18/PF12847.2/5.9e-08,Methyltransf_26/PF13659.1/0.00024,Methyltransf_26/PF13659.1/4.4e+03,GCD14/PF08704.5/0.00033,PrmA/PF06325.8/0.00045,Ubie_methyltran/PF01209.13/0.0006,Methyltransf_11/PF08241.7/0.
MAWRSSGINNAELIHNLKRNGIITSPRVEAAMLSIDRGKYTSSSSPYADHPEPIGYGQTISAPHMHAHTLELLEPFLKSGSKALDVGSGSGYLTACLGALVGESGKVFGIEYVNELVNLAQKNLQSDPMGSQFVAQGRIQVIRGDGWKGLPEEAPFNAIHVGAAAASLPQALVDQLANGGRMVIPIGPQGGEQVLYQIDKDPQGKVQLNPLMGVIYVPLVKK